MREQEEGGGWEKPGGRVPKVCISLILTKRVSQSTFIRTYKFPQSWITAKHSVTSQGFDPNPTRCNELSRRLGFSRVHP